MLNGRPSRIIICTCFALLALASEAVAGPAGGTGLVGAAGPVETHHADDLAGACCFPNGMCVELGPIS